MLPCRNMTCWKGFEENAASNTLWISSTIPTFLPCWCNLEYLCGLITVGWVLLELRLAVQLRTKQQQHSPRMLRCS